MAKLICVIVVCVTLDVSAIMKVSLGKVKVTNDTAPTNDAAVSDFTALEPHGPVTQQQLDKIQSVCPGKSLKELETIFEIANNSVDELMATCNKPNSNRSLLSTRRDADSKGWEILKLYCFGKSFICGYAWNSRCPTGYTKFNYNNGGVQSYGGQAINCGDKCTFGWKLGCYNYEPDGYLWLGEAPSCLSGYPAACFQYGLASTGKTATWAPAGREDAFGNSCSSGSGKAECMNPSQNGRVAYTHKGVNFNGNIINVAFWNIFAREQLVTHDGQYERTQNIGAKAKQILNGEVDVFVFDEAWSIWNEFYTELKASGFKYYCSAQGNGVKALEPTGGTMIASKWPFTSCYTHKYYQGYTLQYPYHDEDANDGRPCAGKDCWKSKSIVAGHIQKCDGCQKYLIVGTHLQANYEKAERDPTYGRFHLHRKNQAIDFANRVRGWAWDSNDAVIFAGDFNTDWIKPEHRSETQEIMGLMHLTPIVPGHASNTVPDCTYCVDNDLVKKDYGGADGLLTGEYLDYVGFWNDNKKPTGASVYHALANNRFTTDLWGFNEMLICGGGLSRGYIAGNAGACSAPYTTRDLSDHHPVIGTFAYNGATLPYTGNVIPSTAAYTPQAGDIIQLAQAVHHSGALLAFSANKPSTPCGGGDVGATNHYVGAVEPGTAGDEAKWELVAADASYSHMFHLKNVKYNTFLGHCGGAFYNCDQASYNLYGYTGSGTRTRLAFTSNNAGNINIVMQGWAQYVSYVGICGVGSKGLKYDAFAYNGAAYSKMVYPDRNDWRVIKLN